MRNAGGQTIDWFHAHLFKYVLFPSHRVGEEASPPLPVDGGGRSAELELDCPSDFDGAFAEQCEMPFTAADRAARRSGLPESQE